MLALYVIQNIIWRHGRFHPMPAECKGRGFCKPMRASTVNPLRPSSRARRYRPQPTGYRAFVPAPLPPNPPVRLEGELQHALSEANHALGRLDGSIQTLPDSVQTVIDTLRQLPVIARPLCEWETLSSEET